MNDVVIFFVPVGVTAQGLDAAVREQFSEIEAAYVRKPKSDAAPKTESATPLWTWFLPNPSRWPE